MANEYLVPSYFKKMSCKCGECRNTCCQLWNIPVRKSDYLRIINADCSDELFDRLQRAFIIPETVDDDHYRLMGMNWMGECKMLNSERLCSLNCEIGADNIPDVCRLFPRSYKSINGLNVAVCSLSCEKTVELIEKEGFTLESDIYDEEVHSSYNLDAYDINEFKKVIEIMHDKTLSLKDRLLKLSDEKQDSINVVIEAIRIMEKLDNGNSTLSELINEMKLRYQDNSDLYYQDEKEFRNRFPGYEQFFADLLLNSMYYENYPFINNVYDRKHFMKAVVISYGLLKLSCVTNTIDSNNKEKLIDAVVSVYHLVDHSNFYYNSNVIGKCVSSLINL